MSTELGAAAAAIVGEETGAFGVPRDVEVLVELEEGILHVAWECQEHARVAMTEMKAPLDAAALCAGGSGGSCGCEYVCDDFADLSDYFKSTRSYLFVGEWKYASTAARAAFKADAAAAAGDSSDTDAGGGTQKGSPAKKARLHIIAK